MFCVPFLYEKIETFSIKVHAEIYLRDTSKKKNPTTFVAIFQRNACCAPHVCNVCEHRKRQDEHTKHTIQPMAIRTYVREPTRQPSKNSEIGNVISKFRYGVAAHHMYDERSAFAQNEKNYDCYE